MRGGGREEGVYLTVHYRHQSPGNGRLEGEGGREEGVTRPNGTLSPPISRKWKTGRRGGREGGGGVPNGTLSPPISRKWKTGRRGREGGGY